MNSLVASGVLTALACGKNLTYLLNNSDDFSVTNYKILQNYDKCCFVKCMKMTFNGKIQFYYLTGKYKTLSDIVPRLDAMSFITVITNFFQSVEEVRENGFLTCTNVDLSPEHVFVDPNTFKVYLIYVPIFRSFFMDEAEFETEFRTNVAKLLISNPTLYSDGISVLHENLQNAMLPFSQLLEGVSTKTIQLSSDQHLIIKPVLKLISINAPYKMSFLVDKHDYILGRSRKLANGVIPENKMIGRTHCRIFWNGTGYMVEDMRSANGTYLNNNRLHPQKAENLRDGDILRLANLEIKVVSGERSDSNE